MEHARGRVRPELPTAVKTTSALALTSLAVPLPPALGRAGCHFVARPPPFRATAGAEARGLPPGAAGERVPFVLPVPCGREARVSTAQRRRDGMGAARAKPDTQPKGAREAPDLPCPL